MIKIRYFIYSAGIINFKSIAMQKCLSTILKLLLFGIFSCNNNSPSNTTDSNNGQEISQNKNGDNIDKTDNFSIEINKEKFEDYDRLGAVFKIELALKNITNNKITSFESLGFLELVYEDGGMRFYPGERDAKSEDAYFGQLLYGVKSHLTPKVNPNNPWKPKEDRILKFNIPNDAVYTYELSIGKFEFQRTPQQVIFALKYKAISVDGEYADIIRFDVKDSWKEYQKELGLR